MEGIFRALQFFLLCVKKQSFLRLRKIYRQIYLVCQYDFRRLEYNNSESESYYFEYEEVEVGDVKGRC